jgi:protocatechuate 3,4-dioxygenase beta subunit
MFLLIHLAALSLPSGAPTQTAVLSGTVQDTGGKPLSNATVYIRSASPRHGTSVLCPYDHPDCKRSAVTDEKGHFEISGLDPELVFNLLTMADGYTPALTRSVVDPKTGPVSLYLKPNDLAKRDPKLVLLGRIHDEKGKPVARAIVRPVQFSKGGTGGPALGRKGYDALAVTDKGGQFRLGVPESDIRLIVHVTAPGFAPRMLEGLSPGPDGKNDGTLVRGAIVSGRVVQKDVPLPGVAVGLAQVDRSVRKWLGEFTIATDENGCFRIPNVPPDETYVLYGKMADLAARGATELRRLHTEAGANVLLAGDLEVEPGVRLSGRVQLSDGKPVPANTRVVVRPEAAYDYQEIVADKEGRFAFAGLRPGQVYSLVVAPMNGYHISAKNGSYELLSGSRLLGTITADTDGLCFLLDPGPRQRPASVDHEAYRRQKEAPLQGAPEESKK